jgi:hypothetical protein
VLHAENGGKSVALHSQAPLRQLPNLKMKDVHNYICSAIHQNNVSSDEHVSAIGRWRRQPPFQILGARLKAFLEPRRECAAPRKLLFQSRRQLVSFGKSGRKIVLVVVVPFAHGFTVGILIEMLALVVAIPVFFVTFSMAVSVTLSKSEIAREHEDSQRAGKHPFCRFHSPLQSERGSYQSSWKRMAQQFVTHWSVSCLSTLGRLIADCDSQYGLAAGHLAPFSFRL